MPSSWLLPCVWPVSRIDRLPQERLESPHVYADDAIPAPISHDRGRHKSCKANQVNPLACPTHVLGNARGQAALPTVPGEPADFHTASMGNATPIIHALIPAPRFAFAATVSRIGRIGRTSILPTRAGGMPAAMRMASLRSFALIM